MKKLAFLVTLLLGCKHVTSSDSSNTSSQGSSKVNVQLYSLDGSGNRCVLRQDQNLDKTDITHSLGLNEPKPFELTAEVNNSTICQLAWDYDPGLKKLLYGRGPEDVSLGNDMPAKTGAVIAKVCSDFNSGKFDKAVIIGYSRGAAQALTVAYEVNKSCGKNIPGSIVKAVGLIDMVDRLSKLGGKRLRDTRPSVLGRSVPPGVIALHILKKPYKSFDDGIGVFRTTRAFVHPDEVSTGAKIFDLEFGVTKKDQNGNILYDNSLNHRNIGRGLEHWDKKAFVDANSELNEEDLAEAVLNERIAQKRKGADSKVYASLKKFLENQGVVFPPEI